MSSWKFGLCLLATSLIYWSAWDISRGQQPASAASDPNVDSRRPQEAAARDAILQSPRWRRLVRAFEEWLSVQQIYTPQQADEISASLQAQVAYMPAAQLADFADEMEDRMSVLLSEDAMDARAYLRYFTEEARQRKLAQSGRVPDVFGMTASQLREELRQFQMDRAARTASHNQFQRVQQQQLGATLQGQRDQQAAMAQRRERAMQATSQQRQQSAGSQYRPMPFSEHDPNRSRMTWTPWGIGYRFW